MWFRVVYLQSWLPAQKHSLRDAPLLGSWAYSPKRVRLVDWHMGSGDNNLRDADWTDSFRHRIPQGSLSNRKTYPSIGFRRGQDSQDTKQGGCRFHWKSPLERRFKENRDIWPGASPICEVKGIKPCFFFIDMIVYDDQTLLFYL